MKKTSSVRFAALFLALLLVSLSFVSCARASAPGGNNYAAEPSLSYREGKGSFSNVYDGYDEKEAPPPAEASPLADKENEKTDAGERKRIYTANLALETREFDSALSRILSDAEKLGGYTGKTNVYNRTARGDRAYRTAEITVRVPSKDFENYLNAVGGYCNVISSSTDVSDVTEAYQDLAARLSSYRTQEERLLAMLEKADDLSYLLQLEDKLSEVRYHIESYEARLRSIDQQVSYSTVTMTLTEVVDYTAPAPETFGQRMREALSEGWEGFLSGSQDIAVFLAAALPVLVLLVILVLVIVLTVKAKRRKRLKRAAQYAQQPASPQQPPVHPQQPPQYRQPPQNPQR